MEGSNNTNLSILVSHINKAEKYYNDALDDKDTMMRHEKIKYHGESLYSFANKVLSLIENRTGHNISDWRLDDIKKYANGISL